MPVRREAEARWEGGLKDGAGRMKLESGAYEGPYSYGSRFEDARGTNPEELIGAAHAGCFSMALAAALGKAGHSPAFIHTRARVQLEKVGDGFAITHIHLTTEGKVPGLNEADFKKVAEEAKVGCPVSKALAGTDIQLEARLVS
jgi:osmotically inducible protein OsmC